MQDKTKFLFVFFVLAFVGAGFVISCHNLMVHLNSDPLLLLPDWAEGIEDPFGIAKQYFNQKTNDLVFVSIALYIGFFGVLIVYVSDYQVEKELI